MINSFHLHQLLYIDAIYCFDISIAYQEPTLRYIFNFMSKIISNLYEAQLKTIQDFRQHFQPLWQEGMTLTLLANQDFLKWYEQPKQWMMYKFLRGSTIEQKKLQTVRVKVSNYSIQQFSQYSKKFLPCQLKDHDAVKIQAYEEYEALLVKYKDTNIFLNHKLEGVNNEQKQAQNKLERKKLQQDIFSLLFQWKDTRSKFRIIIIARKQGFEDLNYYIYNQEYPYVQNGVLPLPLPLQSKVGADDKSFVMMKQIIKIHHVKQKNAAFLQKIKTLFKQNINKSFIQRYNSDKNEMNKSKKDLLNNQQLIKSFKDYDTAQYTAFITQWKDTSRKYINKFNLYIQVFSIWIPKINTPVSVSLTIDGYEKKFQFKEIDNDYLVYKIPEKEVSKCFPINYDMNSYIKKINFQVVVKLKDAKSVELKNAKPIEQKNTNSIKYKNKFILYLLEKEKNLFLNELVLQGDHFDTKDESCIIYFNEAFSRASKVNSLLQYYETQIFQSIGDIPSKYSSTYHLDYNPSTFKSIKTLISRSNNNTKLSRTSYQKTYYELVMASIKQQNQSQRTISLIPSQQRINKFIMVDRYNAYVSKMLRGLGYSSSQKSLKVFFQSNHREINENIYQSKLPINKIHYKNLIEDMNHYHPRNQSYLTPMITRFIYFCGKVKNLQQFPFSVRYSSHLIPIFQKLFILYLSSKQTDLRKSSIKKIIGQQDYLYTFIIFLAKLYPYSNYNNLKSDLYIIRWLVQKHLSYFNDFLNRRNIGLQNLIAPYLLQFFSNLSSQLTYRIWDFLITTDKRQQARIIICFTLLTFLQATDAIPFIPINQFMERVQLNMKKIAVDKEFANKFSKISDIYFAPEYTKQNRLIKHLKTSTPISLIDDKILKKLILGQSKPSIPYEQQGKIPISKSKHYQIQNKLTIRQLKYPLPQPGYAGHHIIQIIIFINDMHILENINLNSDKFWLKLSVSNSEFTEYIQVLHKNHFYNKTIKILLDDFMLGKIEKNDSKKIVVQLVTKPIPNPSSSDKKDVKQQQYLKGQLQYGSYHKDKAYKACIILHPTKAHNKGKSILNLSFCLKSIIGSNNDHTKINYTSLQNLSQKLLDYDLGENNDCCIMHQYLANNFQKIKFPLDQFKSDQYARLTNRALSHEQPQWLQCSLVSIQQLKAIFYSSFTQQKQKSLKHQFSKFYQIYAQENNMQFIYFAELLLKCITLAQISRKKKLMYIYCLATHYQNIYSKGISSQTLNSIIRLLYKQNGLMNACPFQPSTCGKIIQAYYFQSDLKTQHKIDFTELVQDWAHICNFKYGYSDIIFGSAKDLTILRSLFDAKAIRKMEKEKECRFQVIYQLQGFRYLWSVVVETKTFVVVKRGSKFLNQFTSYNEIQYLDSTQQFLLNCENVIPLQSRRIYSYEQFTKLMLQNHLIRYLLDLQVQIDPKNIQEEIVEIADFPDEEKEKEKKQKEKKEKEAKQKERKEKERKEKEAKQKESKEKKEKIDDNPDKEKEKEREKEEFKSWAIYRSQNCLESWHKCNIINPGNIISECKFQFDENRNYSVATLDIISMQQIDLHNDKK